MNLRPAIVAFLVGASALTACSSSGSGSSASTVPSPVSASAESTAASTSAPSSTTVPATSAPAPTTTTLVPTTTVAPATTIDPNAPNPNAPEVVEPGDIPDNQVFVPFTSPDGFTVKVPEGWSQTDNGGVTTFTDNYNAIELASVPAAAAPTVDSVSSSGLTDVSSNSTFHLVTVEPVTRKVGDGVVAKYEIGSAPNPVTGKSALLAVERYFFNHNGKDAVLTLSGAKGADNVDPWKTVTDSLTFS